MTCSLFPESSICCFLQKKVAVSSNYGGYPLIYGDHRLAKNANFLLREFYPEHDEICEVEGTVMLQVLRGTCNKTLAADYGKSKIEDCRNRFWEKIKKNREFF